MKEVKPIADTERLPVTLTLLCKAYKKRFVAVMVEEEAQWEAKPIAEAELPPVTRTLICSAYNKKSVVLMSEEEDSLNEATHCGNGAASCGSETTSCHVRCRVRCGNE